LQALVSLPLGLVLCRLDGLATDGAGLQ
jgi:hypothetical protein